MISLKRIDPHPRDSIMLIRNNTKRSVAGAVLESASHTLNICVVDPSKMTGVALCKVFGEVEPGISFVPERSINQIARPEGAALPVLVIISVGAHSLFSGWVRRELVLAAGLDLPAVVLCNSTDRCEVVEAIRLGVRGYIPADFSPAAAISAVKLVHAGEMFTPASIGRAGPLLTVYGATIPGRHEPRPEEHACSSALTQRERAVLDLICIGRPNKLIARELDIEASTVKVHVKNIMRKLDVTNRTQLCALMHGVEPQAISLPPQPFRQIGVAFATRSIIC